MKEHWTNYGCSTHHWLAIPVSTVIKSPNRTGKEQSKAPFFLTILSSFPPWRSPSPSLAWLSSSVGSSTMAAAKAQNMSKLPDTMKGKGKPPQSKSRPPRKSKSGYTCERVTYKRSKSSANTIHSLHPWKNGTLPDDIKRKWATNMVQSRAPAYPPSLSCKREDCRVHGGLPHSRQTPRGCVDNLKQIQIDQWVEVYLIESDAMKNVFPDLIRGRNPKATLVTPDKALIVFIASFVW